VNNDLQNIAHIPNESKCTNNTMAKR
jgi:hypothetical protein